MGTWTSFVMSVSKAWWGLVAGIMQIVAIALFLFGLAMTDLGWPWVVAVATTVGACVLAYLAEEVQRRYLRWARIPDPNSGT